MIPALQSAPPAVGLQQWGQIFNLGVRVAPPMGVTAASTLLYAAYQNYQSDADDLRWKGLVTTAVGTLLIIPFTLIFMNATNQRLIAGNEGRSKLGDGEIRTLLGRWGDLNMVRGVFPFVAVLVGLWSVV